MGLPARHSGRRINSKRAKMDQPSLQLSDNALAVLRHRYLIRRPDGSVAETPENMFMRVARAVAKAEWRYGADQQQVDEFTQRFYRLMGEGVFLPNSPTLMNAGRELGLLSACFVLPVEDSIEGIFESVKHTAMIQKAGGGTGFAFDRLRPTGDYISTSGGATSGPMSFWRVFSEATNAIQQGAFRRGANMGMLSVTHPDILKFITAKSRPGEFENFNISIKVGDDFLDAVEHNPQAPHVVINPRTHRRYLLPRKLDIATYGMADLVEAGGQASDCYSVGDVWKLIIANAHAGGEPGLCFIDRINADNPTPLLGKIEATNPCGEQPLLPYEACNLGSINLARFVADGKFDEAGFREAVDLSVRFLDDVIDVNNYVIDPIRRICLGNRKIGLGVMGFADALMKLGIPYTSPDALEFGRQVAAALTEQAFAASEALAAQRGVFPNYEGSLWQRRGRAMRNAAVTTVAPTGTLSIIAGCSGGIEPVFALAYWRNILSGRQLLEVNPVFKAELQRRGLWKDELALRLAGGEELSQIADLPRELAEVFVTAHQVPPVQHVLMQAVFQRYIDGAISKTINLPRQATPAQVEEVYLLAYHSGCKGITIYRDGSRTGQPMATQSGAEPSPITCPQCHQPLDAQITCSRCPKCGYTICS